MGRVRGIPRYFRFPWRTARQIHREVDDELMFHLDCRVDELRVSGLSQEEAERLAHQEFGDLRGAKNSLKKQARRHEARRRRELMFSEFFRDLKYAWRSLSRSPGFTAVAVLVLALGIGANAAIFNLVNLMLMRPVNVVEPERLLGVYSQSTEQTDQYRAFSYPNYVDLREQNEVFSELAAHDITMVGHQQGEQTRRLMVGLVSSNYFRTFGVEPMRGRGFSDREETDPSARVAVVSHDFYQRHGSAADLGAVLRLNGLDITVVGIAAQGFTGSSAMFSPEMWMPLSLFAHMNTAPGADGNKDLLTDRELHQLMLFGRLDSGIAPQAADSQLGALAARLEKAYPKALEEQTFVTHPLPRLSVSTVPNSESQFLAPSILLMAMAATVLLIACLNLANMFLARGAGRRTELAVRLSLGGGRFRLLRQLLSEGLVLSLIGGTLGLVLAVWGTRLLLQSLTSLLPFGLTIVFDTSPDWRVIGVTLLFCLAATVLSGFGPAWKLSSGDVFSGLKDNAGQGLSGTGDRWISPRNLMVLGQIALSLMLLASGGLFVRGALAAADADPGFSLHNSVLAELDTSLVAYDEPRTRDLYARALDRLAALPGVEGTSMASLVPFGPVSSGRRVRPAGNVDDATAIRAEAYVVSHGYFESLRLPLLQGRDFTAAEALDGSGNPVAIINDRLAERLWPDESPVGKLLQIVNNDSADPPEPLEIVGVAPGTRHQLLDRQPTPHLFLPFGQNFRSNMTFHLRLEQRDGVESAVMEAVGRELRALDAQVPILGLKTFSRHRDAGIFLWVLSSAAKIFTVLGLVALFLALVGVYGVKAFLVTRRTREIGLRLALGATPKDVLRQMLRESLPVTLAALAIGSLLAFGASKVLSSLIYDSQQGAGWIILGSALLLCIASLLAAYWPTRRAIGIAPTEALRQE